VVVQVIRIQSTFRRKIAIRFVQRLRVATTFIRKTIYKYLLRKKFRRVVMQIREKMLASVKML
jgi:hypothetical protein